MSLYPPSAFPRPVLGLGPLQLRSHLPDREGCVDGGMGTVLPLRCLISLCSRRLTKLLGHSDWQPNAL